jgi:hypothetical protein
LASIEIPPHQARLVGKRILRSDAEMKVVALSNTGTHDGPTHEGVVLRGLVAAEYGNDVEYR